MVGDFHLEIEKMYPCENQIPKEEKSIIKPKRRPVSSSSVGEIVFSGGGSSTNMLKSREANSPESNQALLDEFKIQEDVKIYS